jgi:hypothetical protein
MKVEGWKVKEGSKEGKGRVKEGRNEGKKEGQETK